MVDTVWVIVAPFASLALRAWVNAIHFGYKEATEDGDFSWWDMRCLFILLFTSIPNAIKCGFQDFPFGTLTGALLKLKR